MVPDAAGQHLDAIQSIYTWLLLVWVVGLALILPLAWIVRRMWSRSSPQAEESPELILKRRYARGEISRDEYKALLKDLRSS